MNIQIIDTATENRLAKAEPSIIESLTNAVLNYSELVNTGKSNRYPSAEVNTDTCMEAFGDMLETPIPDRMLIYTVGRRSRKKPMFATSNLEMFKWYLTTVLELSLSNVNAHSSRYWVEKQNYPSWLLFNDGNCSCPLFEPDEYRIKYYKYLISNGETLHIDSTGNKYALLPMENRIGPSCKGIYVYADGFVD